MAKKDLKDLLGKKSPSQLRQGVQSIDILQEAAAALSSSEKEAEKADKEESSKESSAKIDTKNSVIEQSIKPIKSSDEQKRTSKPKQKTERQNRSIRRKPKVFSQRDVQAVLEVDKRQTERYSFEIYSDQKDDIQQVCDLYEKATGKKLSASRLIREVLDTFLPDALKTFDTSTGETTGE